jgi:hypothetical protein
MRHLRLSDCRGQPRRASEVPEVIDEILSEPKRSFKLLMDQESKADIKLG